MKKMVIITPVMGIFHRLREGLSEWFQIGAVQSSYPCEANAAIRCEKPDIVLLDPFIPKGPGVPTPNPEEITLQIIEQARKDGFQGDFVLIMGWDDERIQKVLGKHAANGVGQFQSWADHLEKLKKILKI